MFKYPAHETHFAGYDPDEETDHSSDGIPLVSLLQGFLLKTGAGRPKPCPSTLPDGKTLSMHLDAHFLEDADGDRDAALVTRTIWNPKLKQCEVHLIWDLAGWDKWQRGIAERREKFQADRRAHRDQAQSGRRPRMTNLGSFMPATEPRADDGHGRRRATRN